MRTFWTIFFSFVIAVGLAVEGTFYYANYNISQAENSMRLEIERLNGKIIDLQKTAALDTTSWPIYSDPNIGFSIKYPKTWVYSSPDVNNVKFAKKDGDQWQLSISYISTTKTLDQAIADEEKSLQQSGYTTAKTSFSFAGIPAAKISISSDEVAVYGDTKIIMVYNGKLFTITQGSSTDEKTSNMFSTFQFTK